MSSPAFDELQQRLQRIEQNLSQVGILLVPSEINAGIKQAIVLSTMYPDSALASARKVLDFIATDLYRREFKKNPGTQPLENKLRELERAGRLPKRLAAYAATVRDLGNIGAHGDRTDVATEDVVSSLENLMKLVAWYCEQVRPSSVPDPPVAGPKVEVPADPPPVPPVPPVIPKDAVPESAAARTEPPGLMLILPRAAEEWAAGSRQTIVWVLLSAPDAPPVERTTIELCSGNGQRVMVIAAEPRSFLEPSRNRASYAWEVPANLMPGTAYSIRITIWDRAGQTAFAISANFAISTNVSGPARPVQAAPPPLPYPPPPPPPPVPAAPALGPRGFSVAQIVVATLLGLVAGPLLFAWNDLRLGKGLRAVLTVAVAMVVNYTADQMGPQAMLLVLPGALVMWFLAKVQQGGAMRAGRPMLRKGAYWWAAVGLGLIVLMLQAAAFNGFE